MNQFRVPSASRFPFAAPFSLAQQGPLVGGEGKASLVCILSQTNVGAVITTYTVLGGPLYSIIYPKTLL